MGSSFKLETKIWTVSVAIVWWTVTCVIFMGFFSSLQNGYDRKYKIQPRREKGRGISSDLPRYYSNR